MSTFVLPSSSPLPRKKPLSERVELGMTVVLSVTGLLLSVLSLLYLFYANSTATQDYHLRALQERRAELLKQSEVLQMQIANTESLVALENNEQIAAMKIPQSLEFIKGTSAVARTK